MLRETFFVFAALTVLAGATTVNNCENELPLKDGIRIMVTDCDVPTCLLKQGTKVTIQARFTPERVINSLINDVSALLFNVPLPFVGVDGTNACDNIYNVDGSKAGCPMQPGVEYVYRNSFDVLSIYPRVALTVRYALREGDNKVICFEIPSKITK
ncbi:ecdysteroid-regulated 16 kDa protein [Odontomachus brunneus]|uniref:ecdysteroid-regulated 16 kDa protein n=1 Tax=Odontomachus brunneus TaxID=486640 RepID=UPI0013F241BF|nr:ecdysteroid-regulated 16 kDa protein [Odontomachus brunneus]